MRDDKVTIASVIEKIEEVAINQYNGNVVDNIYSIYPILSDVEKVLLLKYAYKLNYAFMLVIDTANLENDMEGMIRTKERLSVSDNKDSNFVNDRKEFMSAEEYDRKELINLKHKSVIYATQIVASIIGIVFAVILVSSLIGGNYDIFKKLVMIINIIFGSE